MDTLQKKWFVVFRFYSKVPLKCRKCHFRDPKFKYFLVENPPGPPYICHHFVGAQMFFSHRAQTHVVSPLSSIFKKWYVFKTLHEDGLFQLVSIGFGLLLKFHWRFFPHRWTPLQVKDISYTTSAISSISNVAASLGCCKLWQADLMLETVFLTSLLISSWDILFTWSAWIISALLYITNVGEGEGLKTPPCSVKST